MCESSVSHYSLEPVQAQFCMRCRKLAALELVSGDCGLFPGQTLMIGAHSPEGPELHQGKGDWQVEEGNSPQLLHYGEIPPGVLHPALGFPVKERHGPVAASAKSDQRAGMSLL